MEGPGGPGELMINALASIVLWLLFGPEPLSPPFLRSALTVCSDGSE